MCYSTEKVSLDTALDLSLYLSRETEYMAVTQGLAKLSAPYEMMERRDMEPLEKQMKVSVKEADIKLTGAF